MSIETAVTAVPIETPLSEPRLKVFPSALVCSPIALQKWSSLSGGYTQPQPGTSRDSPGPSGDSPASPMMSGSSQPFNAGDWVPSPALYVDCSGIGANTPSTSTPRPRTSKRPAIPSSSRHLEDDEIYAHLHYGSEIDSDDDCDEPALATREEILFANADEDSDVFVSSSQSPGPHTAEHRHSPPPSSPISPRLSSLVSPVSPSSTLSPRGKFDFDWKPIPVPQISSRLRREVFSEINVGPNVSFQTPYDAFTAIWDLEIIETIVRETNKYAQQFAACRLEANLMQPRSRITRWYDTSVNEIYTFLAIVMAMAFVVKSCSVSIGVEQMTFA